MKAGRLPKRAARLAVGMLALASALAGCERGPAPILVGAVYPLSGTQGPGGVSEFRGVRLAVDMINGAGGVHGRTIQLDAVDTPDSDAARASVDALAAKGARLILGSYGSSISLPAADEAAGKGILFWETGAVGDMTGNGLGHLVFRVAPTGASLGRSAIQFIAQRLAPVLHRRPGSLRFAVAFVNDVYGRAVARGALDEIHALGLDLAGRFGYATLHFDASAVARRIAASRPDVLFLSAYLQDGVALRRATVRQHVHLLASIGTSSSYCMPQFGAALGADAVGLFASDKPDSFALNPAGLAPAARALLQQAGSRYRARFGQEMDAPALAGFSAAWALFHDLMPAAGPMTPAAVAAAAQRAALPMGSLPNGSGLAFGPPGTPDAGANLEAASVIWEWVGLGQRAVVWPPEFATEPIRAIPIAG
jgi:branched-chain amino acid transport system substrate-binding protein